MRKLLAFTALAATSASAADYTEVQELSIGTSGIDSVAIDAGAGSLEVIGDPGRQDIAIKAMITVPNADQEKGQRKIENDMILMLERRGDVAEIKSYFEEGLLNFGDSPRINLVVHVPASIRLAVDDGSGSIVVSNVRGDIALDDGSGSITMTNVGGTVDIEDGSGSIKVTGVGGDIRLDDGSGSITVSDVAGSVTVDDGSGSISVANVEHDFIVLADGSGGIDFENVRGAIEHEDL